MISAAEAIQKFRDILTVRSDWSLLAYSQFVRFSAIFQSWALRDALWKIERAKQEFFLSTCINRSSVLAHMEDRGYIPRKAQPSTGTVSVTNTGPNPVTVQAGYYISSPKGRKYRIEADRTVAPGATETEVPVKQIEYTEYFHTVSAEKPFYEILLPVEYNSTLHEFSVYVFDDTAGDYEKWDYSRRFKTVSGEKIYDEFYSHTGQTGIRFGNTSFGSILPADTSVRIDIAVTDGETSQIEGQKMPLVSTVTDSLGLTAKLTFISDSSISGGSDQEGLEEARRNLIYWYQSDDLVWAEDYISYVKNGVGGITWMNIWGEQEQEAVTGPDFVNVNKIFLSAYRPLMDDATLSAAVLARLTGVNPIGRAFQWVTPEIISFTVEIKAYMPRNTKNLAEVEQAIRDLFESAYSIDSPERKNEIRRKDFYKLAESSGYFGKQDAYFTVEYEGITTEIKPNEILSIDMGGSEFTAEYVS